MSPVRSGTGPTRRDAVVYELVIPIDPTGSYLLRARSDGLRLDVGMKAALTATLEARVVTQRGRGFVTVIRVHGANSPGAASELIGALADRLCDEAEALREVFDVDLRQGPGPDWPLEL